MTDFSVETHASILDLERRIELLEHNLHGHTAPQAPLELLTRFYVEAHRAVRSIDPQSAASWVLGAYLWDARTLLQLGRHVSDPYPYRPLLAVLDRCVLVSAPGASEARRHLEAVSQDLLTAQGLSIVRPRDTMATLRLSEALKRLEPLKPPPKAKRASKV